MTLAQSLLLLGGYNASIATIGAALLGCAAGVTGTFLLLRKRSLVSDAVAHATLPGVAIAFLVMVALGGDGRNLAGLLAGAAVTAVLGLCCVHWLSRRTRLREDVAIGAVLSVAFGIGVVLLTVIQAIGAGRPAGLESFLLGSVAGMLLSDALLIAGGGLVAVLAVFALRRPLAMTAFDAQHASSLGVRTGRVDWALMALATAVTVIGLKIVGLVLVVALLIIPPVAARFWSASAGSMARVAGALGALSGYFGAAVSASFPAMPAGPVIVLVAFGVLAFSLVFAPGRGALASSMRRRRQRMRLRMRGAVLAMADGGIAADPASLRLLLKHGLANGDGSPTEAGMREAVALLAEEKRMRMAQALCGDPHPGEEAPAASPKGQPA